MFVRINTASKTLKLILIYEIQLSLLIASENYPEDAKTMLWRAIGAFI